MPPRAEPEYVKDHVIIKGYHDQGKVEAVYGPYTQEMAQWYYSEFLADGSGNNWTVMKLTDFRGKR